MKAYVYFPNIKDSAFLVDFVELPRIGEHCVFDYDDGMSYVGIVKDVRHYMEEQPVFGTKSWSITVVCDFVKKFKAEEVDKP